MYIYIEIVPFCSVFAFQCPMIQPFLVDLAHRPAGAWVDRYEVKKGDNCKRVVGWLTLPNKRAQSKKKPINEASKRTARNTLLSSTLEKPCQTQLEQNESSFEDFFF
jgi:hypothetical protein